MLLLELRKVYWLAGPLHQVGFFQAHIAVLKFLVFVLKLLQAPSVLLYLLLKPMDLLLSLIRLSADFGQLSLLIARCLRLLIKKIELFLLSLVKLVHILELLFKFEHLLVLARQVQRCVIKLPFLVGVLTFQILNLATQIFLSYFDSIFFLAQFLLQLHIFEFEVLDLSQLLAQLLLYRVLLLARGNVLLSLSQQVFKFELFLLELIRFICEV